MKSIFNFYLTVFAICLFAAIFFYHSSLDYYFFQDDFFEINISKAKNPAEYLQFFQFRPDIVAYRPISLQNYFFLSHWIFGLNPIGFRLVTYVLFLSSAFLISKVIGAVAKKQSVGLFTAALWVTSSIHFLSLTWIAAAYNIIGTFFFFLTSFFFLKYLNRGKKIFYLITIISFLVAVGSFEFSITWPPIFAIYLLIVLKKSFSQTLKLFSPFIAVSIVYVILRLLLIKVPDIIEYTVTVNIDSAKALFWYILWTFNIPEEFKKQIVNNLLVFNSKFSQEFYPLMLKVFWAALTILVLGIVVPLILLVKKKAANFRLVFFSIAWFLIAILPVLILPNHTFIMYLTLAAIGIYMLIAYLVVSSNKRMLALSVIVVWLGLSATTLSFYKQNFWMIQAQKVAASFAANIKDQFPTLPKNSVVLYPLQGRFATQALQQNHALVTIYNDPTLSIYYNKEDLLRDFEKIGQKPVHSKKNFVYIYIPK